MAMNRKKKQHNFYFPEGVPRNLEPVQVLHWNSLESQRNRFQAVLNQTSFEGKRILDLGAGKGDFLSYLLEKEISFLHYEGVEILDPFYHYVKEKYPQYRFTQADFFAFPLEPNQSWDIVVMIGAMNLKTENNLEELDMLIHKYLPHTQYFILFLLKDSPGYVRDSRIYHYAYPDLVQILQDLEKETSIAWKIDADTIVNDYILTIVRQNIL